MSAFVVAQIQINDPEQYKKYIEGFYPSFERHGGTVLATTKSSTEVIEGEWSYPHTVILQFPDVDAAHAWHSDPEYVELAKIRQNSAHTNLAIVDGIS